MDWRWYFVGDCSNATVQAKAKENFMIGLTEVFDEDCELENVEITCGQVQRRKRRNAEVSIDGMKLLGISRDAEQHCFPKV